MNTSAARLRWHYLQETRFRLGLILTVAGVVLGVAGWFAKIWTDAEERSYFLDGVSARGTIIFKGSRKDWDGPPERGQLKTVYVLHYEYSDRQDRTYHGSVDVAGRDWDRYRPGETLAIEYLAGQPDKSRAELRAPPPLGWTVLVLLASAILLAMVGVVLVIRSWLRARRRLAVVREGIASLGRITNIVGPGGPGHRPPASPSPPCTLWYTFTDCKGVSRDGFTAPLPPGLADHWRAGDPILVLFHPHDIYRHEVDLFGVRTDELTELVNGAPHRRGL
jgi:hypothetical protein